MLEVTTSSVENQIVVSPETVPCAGDGNRWTIPGKIRTRTMRESANDATIETNGDLRELLGRSVRQNTVIETNDAELTFLDLDAHHLKIKPTDEELRLYISTLSPTPDAVWTTQNNGIKAAYIGKYHRQRAVAAALSAPDLFYKEILSHSRHPLAARSDKPDAVCGPVIYNNAPPPAEFKFVLVGKQTSESREEALTQLGLEDGQRYDHDRCPIDPQSNSDAKGCVVVLEEIVYCYRCAGHDISCGKSSKPGVYPLRNAVNTATTLLDQLAQNLVHWTHAKIELQHHYPHLGIKILEEAYRLALEAKHPDDPRIPGIFNKSLDFIRGDVWLSARSLTVTTVDNDACAGLPGCQYLAAGKGGEIKIKIDPVKRSQYKFRTPSGYTPIRPYRGILFNNSDDAIPLLCYPAPEHKIELLTDPMPEDEARAELECAFPKLQFNYLKAAVAAAICSEMTGGQPNMICATGPSGSGKGETARLAASFLGEDIRKVQFHDDPEQFMRNIGMVLAEGHRFLEFDEAGKTPKLALKLGPFFQLGSTVDWRPLYRNERIKTPCRAIFLLPCVRFPDFLRSSAEFIRRTRHVALFHKTPNWRKTSGGDTVAWRDRSKQNAFIANSILTHVWRLCREYDFNFM